MIDDQNVWADLRKVLQKLYIRSGVEDRLSHDLEYLEPAYVGVEEMWKTILDAANSIQLIMLSEAPLFGPRAKYVYNPAAGATSFFSYKDAEAVVGNLCSTARLLSGVRPRKAEMIERLSSAGLIILDLFPYCLKPEFTALDYQQLCGTADYVWLFREIMRFHFVPKLKRVISKADARPKFVFRYARVRNLLEQDVSNLLAHLGLTNGPENLESIHKGRNIDRDRLARLLRRK